MTHHLTALEAHKVREANRLLTAVTTKHSHCCECCLCHSRMLTDTQDGTAVPDVVYWEAAYAEN
jgi:hypothetical protein